MEPKIESKVNYDDRKKELTHQTKETREAKIEEEVIGEVSMETKGVYNESGIRRILSDLSNKRTVLEQNIKALKKATEKNAELEKDPELKKLMEQLEKVKKLDMQIKQVDQLKESEEELKKVKKDVREIKEAVGTRLKL